MTITDADLTQFEVWAREDLIGEKRGSLAQQAAARRTLELIGELRERRKNDALPALIRRALEEMGRRNRLATNTPLRYAVEFTITDDGGVFLRSEECRPVPVVHVAAPPVGKVQKCALCGAVLLDRRDEVVLASTGMAPRWWSGNVFVAPGEEGETTDAPTCIQIGST